MRVGLSNDHVAVKPKNVLMGHLWGKGYKCIDSGPSDPANEMNYPEPDRLVAEALMRGETHKGALICSIGIGISSAVNKVPDIRATVCSEPYFAKPTVEHNSANIIAMGVRMVGTELAKAIADELSAARFEEERHTICMGTISEIGARYGAKWHE